MKTVVFVCLFAALVCPLYSQTTSSALQGRILDPTNAAIGGAQITLTPEAGGNSEVSAVSDANGQFSLRVPVGKYTIRIVAKNFSELSQAIEMRGAGESKDFVLHLPAVSEMVSVTAPAGYQVPMTSTATKTLTPLRDIPQAVTVVTQELIQDQLMMSMGDVVRYVPGITVHQGENNRDDLVIRGNRSSADFFLNGVRDDVQYYRDLYNLERVEALKGPNAMIFGRGGGGGVLNRVSKEAGFQPLRAFMFQGGQFGSERVTADVNQSLNATAAFRLNGMYENSDSFRNSVNLERGAINPTLTIVPGTRTKITTSYEYLRDTRVADRGVTSFQGRPADVAPSTFFGNPDDSHVRIGVHLGSALVEHRVGRVVLRNRTMFGNYDRFYQNYVPGAASADKSLVTLTAYNNATKRKNVFNQTDIVSNISMGRVRHTLLAGAEFGQQITDNFRNSGFFNNTATSVQVPFNNPATRTPVTFRQNATDANNHINTRIGAAFIQDQAELNRYVQLIGGVRFDRFALRYHNNRNNDNLERIDNLVSPRAGIVIKPITPVSVYTSYSVSYLPSSGDQFSALTTITQQVKPEKFNNYEAGVKWDFLSGLSLTTSAYVLDRKNTRSTDPNDLARIVQTGSQRTKGYEFGLNGTITPEWQIAGGYAYTNAYVTSATTAARAGAQVGQVPHHAVSVWNNYRIHPRVSAGLGILQRSDMFTTFDNTVTLPGYVRADGALYITLSENLRLQGNLENLFNRKYFNNADSNTNISPGSPRAFRVGLTARF